MTDLRTIRRATILGFAVSTILASGSAMAALEEIVVTARKVEEKLQDVPISVSVFQPKDLLELGARDMYDLSRFTPAFSFERINRYGVQGGASRPVIRGQSNILGEGNASVFIDGVLFSDSILAFPMDIVERVEVIKGPQAAQFGRSTFSGAINLITKKGSDVPENKVSLRLAQYGDVEANALSRGALVDDKLFYMAHVRYYTMDGMYDNTLDGKKVGAEESMNVNASLEFRASDAFKAILSGGYGKDEDGLAAVTLQSRFANNCYLNVARQYYCGSVNVPDAVTLDRAGLNGTGGLDRTAKRASLQLIYDASNFTITSNTGGFWTNSDYGYDSTYQGAMAFGLLTVPGAPGYTRAATDPVRTGSVNRLEISDRTEWSTELRIDSQLNSMFRLTGGAYYYKNRRWLEEQHFLPTAPTVFSGESQVENWAVFGMIGIDLNEHWSATIEARYAEDKVGNFNETRTLNGQPVPLIEKKFDSVSPRYTLTYHVTPERMFYANVAKGNKPGVINADPRFPPEIQFADEEKAWTYEAGTKNVMRDGRLTLNVDAFYIDWTNQQLTTTYTFTPPFSGTQSYIINAGKSKVRGVEFETQAMLTDSFTAGLTWSWVDAVFVRFNDPEALQLFGNQSLKDYKLPQVPQQQASVFGRYAFPVGEFAGYARADASFTDRKFDQGYNLAHTGYQELVNLTVGIDGEHWSASAWVHNLTDDRTPPSVTRYVDQLNLNVPQYTNSNPAQNNVLNSTVTERAFLFGMPAKRQFGVNVSYKF